MNGGDNILLIGFMGAGKSTVAGELGAILGRPVLETDDLVARLAGQDIPAIFAARGEDGFRRLEARAVRMLRGLRNTIIVTGGGTPLAPANWRRLRRLGCVVCLTAQPEVVAERTLAPGAAYRRPLLAGLDADAARAKITDLLARREQAYARADLVLDSSQSSPTELALTIHRWAGRAACQSLPLLPAAPPSAPPRPVLSYPVVAGAGSLGRWAHCAGQADTTTKPGTRRRALLVTDPLVGALWGQQVLAAGAAAGLEMQLALVPQGEAAKHPRVADRLYRTMLAEGLARDGLVVALGGGAVGDVAGFVAGTYMRGVAYVQLPTTLLAQVDSAVGGKTAIDIGLHKNTVGVFHDPVAVVADPLALSTLPLRELRSGWAEVLKYGLLADYELWRMATADLGTTVGGGIPRGTQPPLAQLEWIVDRCLGHKAAIVAGDPHEQGAREQLNFGHTLGHAVEAAARGRLRHGEAVATGMDFAAYAGEQLGVSAAGTAAAVREGLSACGLWPPRTRLPAGESLLSLMQQDKKVRGGVCRLILLERPGQARGQLLAVASPELQLLLDGWLGDNRKGRKESIR